jgi:hypothetical protein
VLAFYSEKFEDRVMSAVESDDWCVAVFKCKKDNIRSVLVDFHAFVKDVEGAKNQHFLIKDRVDDEAVFSYRVSVEPKVKEVIRSKMAYKLGSLLFEDKLSISERRVS